MLILPEFSNLIIIHYNFAWYSQVINNTSSENQSVGLERAGKGAQEEEARALEQEPISLQFLDKALTVWKRID